MIRSLVLIGLPTLLALITSSVNAFNITELDGKGFTVTHKDVLLLKHSKSLPMFSVGFGDATFDELSGNFFIDDYITEKVGLSDYAIKWNQDICTITLSRDELTASLNFSIVQGGHLAIDVNHIKGTYNRVWLRVYAEPTEEVYGGGEQYSYFNLRHRDNAKQNIFPIWTSEQGVGRNKSTQVTFIADSLSKSGGDYSTTYFPQPTFVSSRKYFYHHTSTNYAVLDFSQTNFHEITVHGSPGRFYLSPYNTLMDTVTGLTSLLGRMHQPPDWVQEGAILGMQGGTSTMLTNLKLAQGHGINVRGLWIQDWSGKQVTPFGKRVNWDWQWDPSWYPGLDVKIKELMGSGIRVLGYINPNLVVTGHLYKEGAAKGYLVKNSTGGVYLANSLSFVFGSVDFTNPDAYNWYKEEVIKKNMIGLGLGGWMADFGEYLPADAVMYNGKSGKEVHNDYPVLWAKMNKEALEETGNLGKVLFFMRAGFSGISNASVMMWAGDQNVDFSLADGVRSTVYGALNMAMSGTGLTHFDIGGYTTFGTMGLKRSKELLLRSGELAVFGPVFRTHEGNQAENNVQWYTPDAIADFARLAKIYSALTDYRKFVTNQTATLGIPAQRPMILHYEDYAGPDTQLLFGPDVLVSPVYSANVNQTTVVLPGRDNDPMWVHVWSSTAYKPGQTVTVSSPVGHPAVFYKANSKFKAIFDSIKNIVKQEPSLDGCNAEDTIIG